ncbi:hypothetical protein F2P44_12755 [Massilia sp. CCM 8695]|uniref:Uncharacterized protein n=1 Tax=Massilia frigida TaxID=2609281 RepID=A0ABX0NH75_9BURK|nr:hypothetical protein [Massilia frigida]NHZ80140.1 hypothetical protein [Massilia frigida]
MPRILNIARRQCARATLLMMLCASVASPLATAAELTQEELASQLTTLMRSGRLVISDNQNLISDATKGDKGLSPDKVIAGAKENYKKSAGKALPAPAPGTLEERCQKAMLESIAEVMAKNQDLINEKGKAYKGFLPAVFARQVAESFTKKMKGEVLVKLTAPKELIR